MRGRGGEGRGRQEQPSGKQLRPYRPGKEPKRTPPKKLPHCTGEGGVCQLPFCCDLLRSLFNEH